MPRQSRGGESEDGPNFASVAAAAGVLLVLAIVLSICEHCLRSRMTTPALHSRERTLQRSGSSGRGKFQRVPTAIPKERSARTSRRAREPLERGPHANGRREGRQHAHAPVRLAPAPQEHTDEELRDSFDPFASSNGCNAFKFTAGDEGGFDLEGEVDDEIHPDDSISMFGCQPAPRPPPLRPTAPRLPPPRQATSASRPAMAPPRPAARSQPTPKLPPPSADRPTQGVPRPRPGLRGPQQSASTPRSPARLDHVGWRGECAPGHHAASPQQSASSPRSSARLDHPARRVENAPSQPPEPPAPTPSGCDDLTMVALAKMPAPRARRR